MNIDKIRSVECQIPMVDPPSDVFTKKCGRVELFQIKDATSKVLVEEIIGSLQQDPVIKDLLEAWRIAQMRKLHLTDTSLVDLWMTELETGICRGQSMKILELLCTSNRTEMTEEWLCQNMNLKDCTRYQILHILGVFVDNHKSAYVYGVSVKSAKTQLERHFPYLAKQGVLSEQINFETLEKSMLIERVSDFIKNDIVGNEPENLLQDYAVCVSFHGSGVAHGAIIYYSDMQKQYFWYDSRYQDSGLFSAATARVFIRGVADEIFCYKSENCFTKIKFTGYRL